MCFSLRGCLAVLFFGNVMGKKVKRLHDFAPFSFFHLLEVFPPLQGLGTSLPAQRGILLGMYGAHPDSLMLETLLILAE